MNNCNYIFHQLIIFVIRIFRIWDSQ